MKTSNASQPKFQDVIDALLDVETPFPPAYLREFSDLNGERNAALRKVWGIVPLARRRALLDDLEELLEAETLVDFESLGLLALEDPDPQVREIALRLLWESENPRLVETIVDVMEKDASPAVRATAARVLGGFVYNGEIEHIPAQALHSVEEALLRVMAGGDDAGVRRAALESLGFSSRAEVIPLLEAAYRNSDPAWVESAILAMGRSADERWSNEVIAHLDSLRPSLQEAAIRSAGELQLAAARDPLLRILTETDDDDIWSAAVWALSQVGGEAVREALEQLIENSEDDNEIAYIEEALDNLAFTEDLESFEMIDLLGGASGARVVNLENDEAEETGDDLTADDDDDDEDEDARDR
jgi:HEAT repeat protein